ncbi:MAG TPA: PQQ-binding-like beta-propeller repeat protein, partial [Polyangia bacterium]|nr:PQQ-binding-like beta-propeller repeat protein [Polyangia bacterium]
IGAGASPPTASNGIVYVTAGNQMFALDEAMGTTRWAQSLLAGGGSSPIVSPAAVFLPLVCGQAWAFQPYDGSVLWHANPNCDGSGSVTGVLDDGNVYLRSPGMTNLVLAADNGATLEQFTSDRIPAFDDDSGIGYFVTRQAAGDGMMIASNSSSITWSFTGDGNLVTAPLVVNHYIYVGSTSGALFAVDRNGQLVWTQATGAPFGDPDQLADVQPLPGMAAAESLLVVTNSTGLVAYGQ